MAGRRLPYELQTLLAQLPALRTLVPTRPPPSLLRRAISIPATSDLLSSSRHLSSLAEDQPAPVDLFESTTTEYDDIPLSKLDHPPSSRSPDQVLLALLDSERFQEADNLLRDFKEAGQPILFHPRFAQHARTLFNADRSSAWLEWWALAPSMFSLSSEPISRIKKELRRLNTQAEGMVDALLAEQSQDWDRLRDFGVRLAKQGHSRAVSERMLVHLAAYAPPEVSEEVFRQTLSALQRQMGRVAAMGSNISRSRKASRHLGMPERQRLQEQRSRAGQVLPSARTWLAQRTEWEVALLASMRQAMIRAHANFGRLEHALELMEAPKAPTGIASRVLKARKSTLMVLLSLSASADRFDFFKRIYGEFERAGDRLTRVQKEELRERWTYFARGIGYEAPDPIPSAKEAFATWRYRSYVGELEEGGLTEPAEMVEGKATSAKSNLAAELAQRRPEFARASKHFLAMVAFGQLPTVSDTSRLIRLGRKEEQTAFLGRLEQLFDLRSGASLRFAQHWSTALMMAHNDLQEWDRTLRTFTEMFNLGGLNSELQLAFRSYAPSPLPLDARRKIHPTAHVLSIAVQALIPTIDPKIRDHDSPPPRHPLVDRIFHSLLAEPPQVLSKADSGAPSASPLDPHTFDPFFQALFQRRLPPAPILDLLLSLIRFGVIPTKQQFGIVLASFARRGRPNDVLFLLDLLEETPSPHQPTEAVLEQLALAGDTVFPSMEQRGGPPDVKAYTSILVGLTQQGEWPTAREVERRAEDRGFETDFGWRVALQKLGSKDGLALSVALEKRRRQSALRARTEKNEDEELARVAERLSV